MIFLRLINKTIVVRVQQRQFAKCTERDRAKPQKYFTFLIYVLNLSFPGEVFYINNLTFETINF